MGCDLGKLPTDHQESFFERLRLGRLTKLSACVASPRLGIEVEPTRTLAAEAVYAVHGAKLVDRKVADLI
jgi:hypothetical protein